MAERYAKLTRNWLLRGWSDLPFALVDWTKGEPGTTNDRVAYVIKGCDGETDFSSLLFLPVHIQILEKLIADGIAEECHAGDTISPVQRLRKAPNPYLRGIHWSITGRCNMRCRHCYIEAPDQRYPDLSSEEIQGIIAQFERANVLRVSITGGEPFVREDFFDILRQLVSKRILVHQIYSNGLLITDQVLREISEMQLSPLFCLSFDGCGTHDKMRGTKDTEQRILNTIQRVHANNFEVNIATSIDSANMDGLTKTYDCLKELNIHSWQIAPPNRTGNWCNSSTGLSPEDELKIYRPLLQRWYDDGRPFHLQLGSFLNSRVDSIGDHQPENPVKFTPESYDCGVCRFTPYLLPDGSLLPCHGYTGVLKNEDTPNLLKQELSEIWSDSALYRQSQTKKSDRLAHNQECGKCDFFEHCGMGCPARALLENGNAKAKDPISCEIWQKGLKQKLLDVIQ